MTTSQPGDDDLVERHQQLSHPIAEHYLWWTGAAVALTGSSAAAAAAGSRLATILWAMVMLSSVVTVIARLVILRITHRRGHTGQRDHARAALYRSLLVLALCSVMSILVGCAFLAFGVDSQLLDDSFLFPR